MTWVTKSCQVEATSVCVCFFFFFPIAKNKSTSGFQLLDLVYSKFSKNAEPFKLNAVGTLPCTLYSGISAHFSFFSSSHHSFVQLLSAHPWWLSRARSTPSVYSCYLAAQFSFLPRYPLLLLSSVFYLAVRYSEDFFCEVFAMEAR